jgi:hypothetical protein
MQNEAPSTQVPFWHRPEQHAEAAAPSVEPAAPAALQGLPAVRQVVLSAWQCPPTQLWLQHSPEVAQV